MGSFVLSSGHTVCTGAMMTPKGQLQAWPHCYAVKGTAPPAQSFLAPSLKPMPYHNAGWDAPSSGDCCAAAICEIINLAKIILGGSGGEIPDDNVIAWAKRVGTWSGGIIQDVLIAATTIPLIDAAGQPNLLGGPPMTVNFEDMPSVYAALNDHYALDLGVDSSLYQSCVTGPGQVVVAPILSRPIGQYDHSIPAIARWGTAGWLADQYRTQKNIVVPLGSVPEETPCIVTVSWGCEIITPVVSFQRSTNEAHAVPSFPAPIAPVNPNLPPDPPPDIPVDPPAPPAPGPRPRPTPRGLEVAHAIAQYFARNPDADVHAFLDHCEAHPLAVAAMEELRGGRR